MTLAISKNRQENNVNPANLITLVGIILVCWNVTLRSIDLTGWRTFLLTISIALTDWADGRIARWRNETTRLGAILDRLRDKAFVISHLYFAYCSLVAAFEDNRFLIGLTISLITVLIILELALFTGGFYGTWTGKRVRANIWGKSKMVAECLFLITWALINDLSLFSLVISSRTSLIVMDLLLVISLYLGWKSIGGYAVDLFPEYFGKPQSD